MNDRTGTPHCATGYGVYGTKHFHTAGFTLVELMVALVLSLFLIGGVTFTYLAARATAIEAETLSRVQENVRFASDYLIRDLRNAGFRDQLTLTIDQFEQIGEAFAEYGDNGNQNVIIVRYAGRGTCGDVFSGDNPFQIIENTYRLDDGELICEGRAILADDTLAQDPVTLVSGVSGLRFQFLGTNGVATDTPCDYSDETALEDACIGVRVTMTFEGQPERKVELVAAFRNVILDRLYGRD